MPYRNRQHQLTAQKQYRETHREELREASRRYEASHKVETKSRVLLRRYGITLEQQEELWQKQRGRCELCKLAMTRTGTGKLSVCVDHDHLTGKVRGLLHRRCNVRLGVVEDAQFVTLAQTYLEKKNGSIA